MADAPCETDDRFGFGANWQHFLKTSFDDTRVGIARAWLLSFLQRPDLTGLSFIDIGCGSGIHSLAAWRSGAARVVSFDFDRQSVEATGRLRHAVGAPGNWEVHQGSILDPASAGRFGRFDIVYSWGVLHHTGDQWTALDNTVAMVAEAGLLYIALYAREQYANPSPEYWLDLKRRYNRAGRLGRAVMEAAYVWRWICRGRLGALLRLPKTAAEYRASRGMALMTDVRDWLGGWPMAFSTVREVTSRCHQRHGLVAVTVKTGEGNTEYLFARAPALDRFGLTALADAELAFLSAEPLPSLQSLDPNRPIVIFGTAEGAALLVRDVERHGGPPILGFIDIARTEPLFGRPVYPVETFAGQFAKDTPVVLSNRYLIENFRRLAGHGFTNIHNGHGLVTRLAAERPGAR